MPFSISNILVKGSSVLIEMSRGFKSFHLKEAPAYKGFNREGIFSAHVISIRYNVIFIKSKEALEGVDDNEDKHKNRTSKREPIT